MGMMGGFLRSENSLRLPFVNAGRSHKQRNVLNAIPRRERGDVQAELVGIWDQPTKQEALTQLAAFKAKYAVRYPEAVRSLAEDEEHPLSVLCISSDAAPAHADDQCH